MSECRERQRHGVEHSQQTIKTGYRLRRNMHDTIVWRANYVTFKDVVDVL
jgi:hypothetical protein